VKISGAKPNILRIDLKHFNVLDAYIFKFILTYQMVEWCCTNAACIAKCCR